jgi:hypothetical protein
MTVAGDVVKSGRMGIVLARSRLHVPQYSHRLTAGPSSARVETTPGGVSQHFNYGISEFVTWKDLESAEMGVIQASLDH